MAINARILLILALVGTAIVFVGAVGVASVHRVAQAGKEMRSIQQASTRLEELERSTDDAMRASEAMLAALDGDVAGAASGSARATAEPMSGVAALERAEQTLRQLGMDGAALREAVQIGEIGTIEGLFATLDDFQALQRQILTRAELPASLTNEPRDGNLREALSRQHAELRDLLASSAEQLDNRANGREGRVRELTRLAFAALAGAIAIALLVGIVVPFVLLRRGVLEPLRRAGEAMGALAAGDLNVDFDGEGRSDSIGALNRDGLKIKAALTRSQTMRARLEADLARRRDASKAGMDDLVARLEADVDGVVRSLSCAAEQLGQAAGALRVCAQSGDARAHRVGEAAEETTGNVQAVASAAEELAASAQEIGHQVSQSTTISLEALGQAEETTRVVEGLAGSARKIGQVVDLIEDIASQTNLLALNATIEAARAGDAGKGFAVVAMEVKSLAEQTANATKDISLQINAVQTDVERVVDAIAMLKDSFFRANELASSVASAIEEQSAATSAIAQSVQEAARSTQDVSETIVDVSKAANDTGRGAEEIVAAADELTAQAGTLRTRMADFMRALRSDAA